MAVLTYYVSVALHWRVEMQIVLAQTTIKVSGCCNKKGLTVLVTSIPAHSHVTKALTIALRDSLSTVLAHEPVHITIDITLRLH